MIDKLAAKTETLAIGFARHLLGSGLRKTVATVAGECHDDSRGGVPGEQAVRRGGFWRNRVCVGKRLHAVAFGFGSEWGTEADDGRMFTVL